MGEPEAYMIRKAVALGPQCAVTLNICRTRGGLFDLFGMEYDDCRKANKASATELLSHIEEECSVDFLWCLREAIAEMIERHNQQFGSNHPTDRPLVGPKLSED